jgi:hypothetical protein
MKIQYKRQELKARGEERITPLVEVWRWRLGFLMPFLCALYDWLCAVWFFDLAISLLHLLFSSVLIQYIDSIQYHTIPYTIYHIERVRIIEQIQIDTKLPSFNGERVNKEGTNRERERERVNKEGTNRERERRGSAAMATLRRPARVLSPLPGSFIALSFYRRIYLFALEGCEQNITENRAGPGRSSSPKILSLFYSQLCYFNLVSFLFTIVLLQSCLTLH